LFSPPETQIAISLGQIAGSNIAVSCGFSYTAMNLIMTVILYNAVSESFTYQQCFIQRVGPEAPPPSPQRKSKTSLKKKQDL
jgi:hypothetical protein